MEPQQPEIIDLTGLSSASSDSLTREKRCEMSDDAPVPWYCDPHASNPFILRVKCKATRASAPAFTEVEFFPWGDVPLENIWDDEGSTPEEILASQWESIRCKWRDTAAVCGGRTVRLIYTQPSRQGVPIFQASLPENCQSTVTHVKWALDPRNLHPLILYVHSSVVHIWDVEAHGFLGCIRGHGADITSLSVHRTNPHIFCTTSRDFTTRIYDLRFVSPEQRTRLKPSRNGRQPALRRTDDEGNSCIGKCVMILTGGRSGGHEAAVLGADFHPSLPLIVTCGMDHAVRIWHLKPRLFVRQGHSFEDAAIVYREDKPLFSSTLIHDARVLSVYWLSPDLLVSHSAPPVRIAGSFGGPERGTLAVWQWLSVDRFFPPEASTYRESIRGCISDYRESSSYKMISLSKLPVDASRMSVHRMVQGPPMILFVVRSKILFLNASQLPPRNRPILQDDQDRDDATRLKQIRLSGAMADNTYTDVEGWNLPVVLGEDLGDEELERCVLSPDGRRIAAVGCQEGIWLFDGSQSVDLQRIRN